MHRSSAACLATLALLIAACGPSTEVGTTAASDEGGSNTSEATTGEETTTTTERETTTTEAPAEPALTRLADEPVVTPSEGNRYTNPGAIVFADGEFHMFRNSFDAFPGVSSVDRLTSADGLEWAMQSPVYETGDVPFGERNVFLMEVLPVDDGWVGYFYTFENQLSSGFIGRATADSLEGPWQIDPEPVLAPGEGEAWDNRRVSEPTVIATGDGFVMYYSGHDQDGVAAIGRATSEDGVTWVKHDDPSTDDPRLADSDPVLVGLADNWEAGSIGCPDVETLGDGFLMVYDTTSRARGYGMATSSDGITWERFAGNPVITTEDVEGNLFQSELIRSREGYLLYIESGSRAGTEVYAYRLSPPTGTGTAEAERSIEVSTTVEGSTVTVSAEAVGFDMRFTQGDTSGETGHLHLYVDREPPAPGDDVPLGEPDIIHTLGSEIEVELEPGEHELWVVIADGADRALIPPEPVLVEVTIEE